MDAYLGHQTFCPGPGELLCQFDPFRIGGPGLSVAVIQQQARTEEAVFGEAGGEFVRAGGVLGGGSGVW